jgi:nanoRNase/pAp phosphatase (c-di-AMP/oligoRNAs hydrolase)
MEQGLDLTSLQQQLPPAKDILVIIPQNPTLDKVAAGLALYLSLKKQGKQVIIACPSEMTVAFNRLFAVNKIQKQIGNRDLTITFKGQKDKIEKIFSQTQGEDLNLVIEPRTGCTAVSQNQVSFSYSGAQADIIFILGATKPEDLGKFYTVEKKIFEQALTVNLDFQGQNSRFAKLNLVSSEFASCSELVVYLMQNLNLPADQDIATNLFSGIKANNSNFLAANVKATTFEAAAWCLRKGVQPRLNSQPALQPAMPISSQPPARQTLVQPPFTSVQPKQNLPQFQPQQPPPDWFKPKIFKGGSQI